MVCIYQMYILLMCQNWYNNIIIQHLMSMRVVIMIIISHAVMPVDTGQDRNVGGKKEIKVKDVGNYVRENGEEIRRWSCGFRKQDPTTATTAATTNTTAETELIIDTHHNLLEYKWMRIRDMVLVLSSDFLIMVEHVYHQGYHVR
jgi:hypothetical protein